MKIFELLAQAIMFSWAFVMDSIDAVISFLIVIALAFIGYYAIWFYLLPFIYLVI